MSRDGQFSTRANNRVSSVDVGNSLLSAISGSPRWNYSYDGRGNVISTSVANADAQTEIKPNSLYKYDAFNRMTQVSRQKNGVAVKTNYAYNALNQRVRKDGVSGITHFNYAVGGQLLSETKAIDLGDTALNNISIGVQDPSSLISTSDLSLPSVPSTVGAPTDYIWLGGEIVGIIRGLSVYYIHNDHLGRPEVVANSQNVEVWRADNLPYNRTVNKNVFGGLNIGFPGQYYDAESELYYNWHRYYDPNTGRYMQADPIGLSGGSNPYAYVGGNPVSFVDPYGLFCIPSAAKSAIAAAVGGAAGAAASGAPLPFAIGAGVFAGISDYALGQTGGGLFSGGVLGFVAGKTSGAAVAGAFGGFLGANGAVGGALGGFVGAFSSTKGSSNHFDAVGGPLLKGLVGGAVGAGASALTDALIDEINKAGGCDCGT